MTTKIIGTGSYLPEYVVTNDDLAKLVDTSDEWIASRTGIRNRRIATNESGVDMAAAAAEEALKDAGMDGSEIDLILVATCSSDFQFPSTACLVQKAIHATNAAAFDLSAACSGFYLPCIPHMRISVPGFIKISCWWAWKCCLN